MVVAISGEVLSDRATAFISLLADVTMHPRFDEADLKRTLDKHSRNNAIALSSPGALAQKRFREIMYGSHPFANVFPPEEMLRGFTTARVKDFHAKNMGARRARLYVSGVFNSRDVEQAIRDAFGSWLEGPAPTDNAPVITAKQQVEVIDRANSVQSSIWMGLPVADPSDPDWVKMNVTDALLGGAFGSRITRNIREDKGYTYSPYSQLSSRYRDAYWVQVADVTTAHTADSLREIFHEIEGLRSEPAGDAELAAVKSYLGGTFVLQNSAPGAIIGQLAYIDLHGLPDDYLETYVARLSAVTAADVQRVAQQYLTPDAMTLVVVGDPAALAAQLPTLEWVRSGAR